MSFSFTKSNINFVKHSMEACTQYLGITVTICMMKTIVIAQDSMTVQLSNVLGLICKKKKIRLKMLVFHLL